jgi:hypothetical protein
VDASGRIVASTSDADLTKCARGLFGGTTTVCASRFRYNFWQYACKLDIRKVASGALKV